MPYTITAPTYFFDNALGGSDRIQAGILDLPLPPDRPLQQLARPDLGAFAAKVLCTPGPYVGQRVELASDAVTPEQMAEMAKQAAAESDAQWRVFTDDLQHIVYLEIRCVHSELGRFLQIQREQQRTW